MEGERVGEGKGREGRHFINEMSSRRAEINDTKIQTDLTPVQPGQMMCVELLGGEGLEEGSMRGLVSKQDNLANCLPD